MTKWLAVVAIGCSIACAPKVVSTEPASAPPPDAAAAVQQLELRLDEAVESDGVRVTWTSMTDSRCAQGVTCVWAGEIIVELTVRENGQDQPLTLTLGPQPNADVARTRRHELRLLDVSPYPRHGVEVARADYRAKVELRRQP